MRVREIGTLSALEEAVPEWRAILDRTPGADFFHTPEWQLTWLESFWPHRPLAFLLGYHDGAPAALFPLLSDGLGDNWCSGTVSAPINAFATRSDFLASGGAWATVEALSAALEHLKETRHGLRIGLCRFDAGSLFARELPGAAADAGLRITQRDVLPSPVVDLGGGWEGFLASRAKHVRQELKRKRRRLNEQGGARFVEARTPGAVRDVFEDVLTIERRSWKEAAGSSFTAVSGLADFYRALAHRTAAAGLLRLHVLYAEGRPIAHLFGVAWRGRHYALKTSYDQDFGPLSPGALVAAQAIERAAEEGVVELELLGEPSRWKAELASRDRQRQTFCVHRPMDVHCRMCGAYHEWVKPALREHPAAVRLKRWLDAQGARH